MIYDPEKHNRRSMRLKGYDYSQPGFYYVTIYTQDRVERFGDVQNGKMILNEAGEMVHAEWNGIPERYEHVVMDTRSCPIICMESCRSYSWKMAADKSLIPEM